jgi:hypothetical protein
MKFLFSYIKSMIMNLHCILQMRFLDGNLQLKICHFCMCSLVGSTDLSQRISLQVSKCIAEVGGPYTVCHIELHLRVQLPSICQIGLTRCFGGHLVPLRSFSVAIVLFGMATRKGGSSSGLRDFPTPTPRSIPSPRYLSSPTVPFLPSACSPTNSSCHR